MRKAIVPLLAVLGVGVIAGCDTSTPSSPAQQTAMRDEAKASLERMEAQAPNLVNNINSAAGYVIFPEIGSASIGVGAASGEGVVYQGGKRVGTVKMMEGSIGLQAGGDTYAELIIFQDAKGLNRLMNDSWEFASDAKATAVKAGAAGAAEYTHGSQVYIMSKGGFAAGISVAGQKFKFTPNGQASSNTTSTETNTTDSH